MAENEIDQLMLLDPLELTAKDIDKIVDHYRKTYFAHEQGAVYEKTGDIADRPKLTLAKLGLKPKEPDKIKRRRL